MLALIESTFGLGAIGARVAATGGLIAAVLGAWFAFAMHYENKGAAKAEAKIEQRTQQNVVKADQARKAVARVPDAQLDDRYRRD